MAEHIAVVLTRVLANCRVRMDKRKRKAGAGVEPSPGSLPRDAKGGTSLAGERAGDPGPAGPRKGAWRRDRPTAQQQTAGRLEAAE
jgi:hypothetical protein